MPASRGVSWASSCTAWRDSSSSLDRAALASSRRRIFARSAETSCSCLLRNTIGWLQIRMVRAANMSVCSTSLSLLLENIWGTHATIIAMQFPPSEEHRILVSALSRYGGRALVSRLRMTLPRVNRLLLMWPVSRSLALPVERRRSEPARSQKTRRPKLFASGLFKNTNVMQWLRFDLALSRWAPTRRLCMVSLRTLYAASKVSHSTCVASFAMKPCSRLDQTSSTEACAGTSLLDLVLAQGVMRSSGLSL
mmetsp:Transcript_9580/g.30691  ORF Transcript_9580/g.30691 Transcript_9580/m.30691 type:complete len:251 (+) Transcript_9580:360-1112(+)